MTHSVQKLASEFTDRENASLYSEWRSLAEKTLQGADFENALVRKSEDGLTLGPLFTNANSSVRFTKDTAPHLTGRPWHITAHINHPDIEHANQDMMEDLAGGASALSLHFDPSGKTGIAARNLSDLQRLFSGIHADLVPIQLVPNTFEQSALLAAYFQNHKHIKNIHLSLSHSCDGDIGKLLSITKWVSENIPHWKAVTINGAAVHEMGASPAQELAYMLSKAVSLLRPMIEKHGLETALNLIDVRLASDQDAHFGITKFRAARLLWTKMAEAFGAKPENHDVSVRAVSSARMLATADPWANILRLNAACFGAVCGGANSVALYPFTFLNGFATPFARRISRNLQLMQMEETRLGHVSDPAHGSYMHETLTHDIAAKAWDIFQKIESRGGWQNGCEWFKEEVSITNDARLQKIEDGEILLVGVNQFTKADVRRADVLPRPQIRQRSGKMIDTYDFKTAISQANDGYLIPLGDGHE